MRCLTITLNAAIDTTYVLERYTSGTANRVVRTFTAPGGKGNNVARVLALLGHEVVASGFVAGRAGQFIEDELRGVDIDTAFAHVPGESRRCLALIEQESGAVTELLEPGVTVSHEDGRLFLDTAAALVNGVDAVVVSGSLPAGLAPDYYAQLLGALRGAPVRLALDTSGDALRLGLVAGPDLVKPNAAELASLARGAPDLDALVDFARCRLIGPVLAPHAQVLLSLGAGGAALITRTGSLLARPPAVSVVNPVGSGDALLAGFLAASVETGDNAAALREAVAVGTAAALHEIAGVVDPADVARLRRDVDVRAFDEQRELRNAWREAADERYL